MPQFINRKQLLIASNEELMLFFNDTVFEGVFSSEIKSKQKDKYKGNIASITLDDQTCNIVPKFLNVPINEVDIPEGKCTFKCFFNLTAYREDNNNYFISI